MDNNRVLEIFEKARGEGRNHLLETEAKIVCLEYKIPVTRFKLARTIDEAVAFAKELNFPVVLKVVSPQIIHKSDVNGVILDLRDEEEVRNGYQKIFDNVKKYRPDAKIIGVLVQEMAPKSTEIIVGAIKDPQFDQTLMFGLGGIFVEVLRDVSFRVAPLTREDASEMIREIKSYPILEGARGTPPADIDAIISILLSTSRLVMDHPEIKELDLNPILVYGKGAKVVDARIILE